MDERYLIIEEYLQECVNNDIYTEEFANQILDLAYDKYLVEANAFNKYAAKLKKEQEKDNKKYEILSRVAGKNKATEMLQDKHRDLKKKIDKFNNDTLFNATPYHRLHGDIEDYNSKGKYKYSDKSDARAAKQAWMSKHGNVGEHPEDKYKAGRYLTAQKELRELEPNRKRITKSK